MQARRLALYSVWMFWHKSLCGIELWKGRETAGWCQLQYQVLPILRQSRGILIVSLSFSSSSFILSIYQSVYSVFSSFLFQFLLLLFCLSIHLFSFFRLSFSIPRPKQGEKNLTLTVFCTGFVPLLRTTCGTSYRIPRRLKSSMELLDESRTHTHTHTHKHFIAPSLVNSPCSMFHFPLPCSFP